MAVHRARAAPVSGRDPQPDMDGPVACPASGCSRAIEAVDVRSRLHGSSAAKRAVCRRVRVTAVYRSGLR
jgi:hypothetical protein